MWNGVGVPVLVLSQLLSSSPLNRQVSKMYTGDEARVKLLHKGEVKDVTVKLQVRHQYIPLPAGKSMQCTVSPPSVAIIPKSAT